MAKEMGEWLMVQGPTLSPSGRACLCIGAGLSVFVWSSCAVQQHGNGGEAGHGETQLSVNTEQQPQERQQLTTQRSEEEPCAFPGKWVPSA